MLAQPLFSVLSANATFFAIRGSRPWDIITFALVLTVVPAAILFALEFLVALIAARAQRVLHLVLVALLVAVGALWALKHSGHAHTSSAIVIALVLGVLGALIYWRARPARLFVSVLTPAPMLFLIGFLFFSPVTKLVTGSGASVALADIHSRTPVVMIVLDEFSVTGLMGPDGRIDASRFPNFAALSREGYWFRNTSSVHDHTESAVPAILTGDFPAKGALPIFADHRQNLFTLLGRDYRVHATELTHLCPPKVCPEQAPKSFTGRMGSLASDLKVVYLHTIAPQRLEADLPPINLAWLNFGQGGAGGGVDNAVEQAASLDDRHAAFERFLRGVAPSSKPTLNFIHLLLPHVPYEYLPSGHAYDPGVEIPGLQFLDSWTDLPAVVRAHQRYLLQVAYVDRLVGELIHRLRATGTYDPSLVVVTADHGVGFQFHGNRRYVTPQDVHEIAPVPLFVKLPGQHRGRTVTTHLQTIDILPTIADILHVHIPWHVDGHSAFAPGADRRQVVIYSSTNPTITIPTGSLDARRAAALRQQDAVFPPARGISGLFDIGPHRELVGKRVADLRVSLARGSSATIDQARALGAVRPSGPYVPARITGTIAGKDATQDHDLAIAVNGRIAAVSNAWNSGTGVSYDALVPESALREGANRVEVLAVSGGTGNLALERLAATPSDGR